MSPPPPNESKLMPTMITANRLSDGVVVFQAADGGWAEDFHRGAVFSDEGAKAAAAWLKTNPKELAGWLDGVTTFDGQPGLPAVKKSLGL